MNKLILKINDFVRNFGVKVNKLTPRPSIRFAREHLHLQLAIDKINVIEIGVLMGQNAMDIADSFNINSFYLIDPYTDYKGYNYFKEEKSQINKYLKIAMNRLKHYPIKCKWIFLSSTEAVKFIHEKIHFIYIDGNHQYEYVKQDIKNYFRILEKDGILAGHDYNQLHEYEDESFGVKKAVDEFVKKNKLKLYFQENDWWIVK